jgi:hypothetical protein
MAVTEPSTGTDTTKIKTLAVKKGDRYVVNGQKVWISRVQHSDLMILLARTTPLADVRRKAEGMSIFIIDLRDAVGKGLAVRPIANMVNHETNELFFENLEIPAENLIGHEGQGFKYILDGLNAERTLIAAECIGDGRWFIDRATAYTKDRGLRPSDRAEPGRAVPDRRGAHRGRSGRPYALESLRDVRRARALRRRGQHLRDRDPGLVVCDISGYGNDGPYRDKKAYDLLIQSESGFLSITGTPDEPAKAGCSIADIAAGMYAYTNVLAALLDRETLRAIIAEVFSRLSAEKVIARLDAAQIANAHMNDMHDVWQHEQLKARRRWVDVDTPAGALPALLPPGAPDAASVRMDPVPALGEHTDTILAELGYSSDKIAALRGAKTI